MEMETINNSISKKKRRSRIKRSSICIKNDGVRKNSIKAGSPYREYLNSIVAPNQILYRKHSYLGQQFTQVKESQIKTTLITKKNIKFVLGDFNSIQNIGNTFVNTMDNSYSSSDWKILKETNMNTKCNCKKSSCLKSYCDCHRMNRLCGKACYCKECKNTLQQKTRAQNQSQLQPHQTSPSQHKIPKQKPLQHLLYTPPQKRSTRLKKSPQSAPLIFQTNQISYVEQDRQFELVGCGCKNRDCLSNYCVCRKKGINCGWHCGCKQCSN